MIGAQVGFPQEHREEGRGRGYYVQALLELMRVDAVVSAMQWFRIGVSSSYGTEKREGGGGLGAGTGASGPSPKCHP